MQPPRRTPVSPPTPGQASQQKPTPTRHQHPPHDLLPQQDGAASQHLIGTRDHALIREWADYHGAHPATGEASDSGPATIDVNDQGTGLRFNFPAAGRFRQVEWSEWFTHFEREHLVFVFEVQSEDPTTQSSRFGSAFFRLVPHDDWDGGPLASLDAG